MSRTCCIAVEGYAHEPGEDREIPTIGIAPGYFATMRLPLLRGRDFVAPEARADPDQMSVAIVNEAFVRRYAAGRDPIGARFGWGDPPRVTYQFEIVGVARDAVYDDLREHIRPLVYFPFSWGDTFVVRAAGPPDAVGAMVRRAMTDVDPNLDVSVGTVARALERAVTREKLLSRLASFFGVLATVLAGIGLYGLMAYAVVRRTREIGLRMALGAAGGSILRAEMLSALRLVALGVVAGVPLALAAGRLIDSQLFGISATDPVTLAMAAMLLACVAGAAAFLPARRASRVDPLIALRSE
jgi:predicted permease